MIWPKMEQLDEFKLATKVMEIRKRIKLVSFMDPFMLLLLIAKR